MTRPRAARHGPLMSNVRHLCLAGALFLPLLAVACDPPPPPAPRTLTVGPATGLADQVVTVNWTGFHKTETSGLYTVTVFQCKGAVPTSMGDCFQVLKPPSGPNDGTGVYEGSTGANGTGSAFIEVRPAQALPALNCTSVNPCSVVAFENDGNPLPATGLPATAATATIRFAPSPADCPTAPSPDVRSEGSASTSHALYTWAARVCTGARALSLDYTEISSPAGRRDFLNGSIDVGLTSSPATSDELTGAPGHRSFAYAPVDVTGVVVGFNVTDTVTHERITDMSLTPRLVAMLVAGSGLHLFQDPEFAALNAGHNWPVQVQAPLLRAERNADALLLTTWLQADPGARTFLDGNDPTAPVDPYWKGIAYPTDIFEARNPNTIGNYNPRTGTLVNARRLFNFQAPGDGVSVSAQNDGILGVFDAVTARQFGFTQAKLRRAGGSTGDPFVAPDLAGLAAGYKAMTANPDGVTKWADVSAAGAYPLVKIDYGMVPTSGVSVPKAEEIARFLEYAAGTGQQPGNLTLGYLPMPPDLQAQTAAARAATLAGAQPAPTPPAQTPPADQASLDGGGLGSSVDTGAAGADGFAGIDASGDTGTPSPAAYRAAVAAGAKSGKGNLVTRAFGALVGSAGWLVMPMLLGLGLVAAATGPVLSARARKRAPTGPPVP
jgi:ABC-type phosphate transport system substrate-binding protein